MFWNRRRGNVSPTMVDASVSTEGPSKCDVATMTDDMVVGGEDDSYIAPPVPYEEWCNRYVYGRQSHEFAEWCFNYACSTLPAYLEAWSYGTPTGPM